MIKILIFLLTTLTASQSFAAALKLDYSEMLREVKACRRTSYGCTVEQELEIGKFNGTILDSVDLEKYLAKDLGNSYFIPLSLTNSELLTLAAATSLGVVAFNHDQEIMDVVQRNKTPMTEKIQTVGNFLGAATGPSIIAAGSYFLGVYFENSKLKQAGLFMVGASLASGIVGAAVKSSIARKRPNQDVGPYEFFEDGHKSFYSGHTTVAFSVATVIAEMYKDDYPIVPYVAYGIAAITAYARVHHKAHWASDVIIGAIAGHLVSKLALSAMNGNQENRKGYVFYPGLDPTTGSFMLYFEWTGKDSISAMKCSILPEGIARIEACLAEGFSKASKR